MGKYIRATIKYEAMAQIDDTQGLFRLAEFVPVFKENLLVELKKNIADRTKNLTVDSLTFEEVIFPDLPTKPQSGSKGDDIKPRKERNI